MPGYPCCCKEEECKCRNLIFEDDGGPPDRPDIGPLWQVYQGNWNYDGADGGKIWCTSSPGQILFVVQHPSDGASPGTLLICDVEVPPDGVIELYIADSNNVRYPESVGQYINNFDAGTSEIWAVDQQLEIFDGPVAGALSVRLCLLFRPVENTTAYDCRMTVIVGNTFHSVQKNNQIVSVNEARGGVGVPFAGAGVGDEYKILPWQFCDEYIETPHPCPDCDDGEGPGAVVLEGHGFAAQEFSDCTGINGTFVLPPDEVIPGAQVPCDYWNCFDELIVGVPGSPAQAFPVTFFLSIASLGFSLSVSRRNLEAGSTEGTCENMAPSAGDSGSWTTQAAGGGAVGPCKTFSDVRLDHSNGFNSCNGPAGAIADTYFIANPR